MTPNNPMTEGEALAVLRELRDTGDVSDWQAMESALTMAMDRLTAHTAASGGEVVAERHRLYGIRWIKQLREMEPGTQWFIEGRSAPIATVLSSAGVQWHTAESEIPHGTKYYARPPAAVPADALERLVEQAMSRAQVFDDGSDGADAESAQSVMAILKQIAALIPKGADHGQR